MLRTCLSLQTFALCLTFFCCAFVASVLGGLQSPVCDFECSNIEAIDAVCENHICSSPPLSDQATEILCSDSCRAAIADLSSNDCGGILNLLRLNNLIENLDSTILRLCARVPNSVAIASVGSEEEDEDDLSLIEADLDG
eukprot:g9100.t1